MKLEHKTAKVLLVRLRELWAMDDTAYANVQALMLVLGLDDADPIIKNANLHWLEAEICYLETNGDIESWSIKGDIYDQRITQIDDPYNRVLLFKAPASTRNVRGCCG